MDRTRASSLESQYNFCDKYDFFSNLNPNKVHRRNRLNSNDNENPEDLSEKSGSLENYSKRDYKLLGSSDLKSQFDNLQSTVNKMLNGGIFDEMSPGTPSVNLSEALKHEYHQMMNALKELEDILGCKNRNSERHFSNTPCNNEFDVKQLQREIYCRDSLIKCLSDRLKVLCKANDKMMIDYENQENILSEELISLKRQLEKAKDSLKSLAAVKSRANMSVIQDIESETYYLREALRTKEMLINDLKHRLDKLNSQESVNSRMISNQFERELSFKNHLTEQLQAENDSLKSTIECKNQLIDDLRHELELERTNLQDRDMIDKLKEELIIISEENEMSKEAIFEQSELLTEFKNQIKILSRDNEFKDETIDELRCCISRLAQCSPTTVPIRDDCGAGVSRNRKTRSRCSQNVESKCCSSVAMFNSIRQYICIHKPDLEACLMTSASPTKGISPDDCQALEKFIFQLIDMVNTIDRDCCQNDIELFKEFLTNELNLKNTIGKYLTSVAATTTINDVFDKFQTQMNCILLIDMDNGFKCDLKNYLHQCYLLDESLKSIIEYLVKQMENRKSRGMVSFDFTNSQFANITTNTGDLAASKTQQTATSDLITEIDQLQSLIDKQAISERELKADYEEILCKANECQAENCELRNELHALMVKIDKKEHELKMKNSELNSLDASLRRASDHFVNFSSTQEQIKKSMSAAKDSEIEMLTQEIEDLKSAKTRSLQLEQMNSEQELKISMLLGQMESLEKQAGDLKALVASLQKQLTDQCNAGQSLSLELSELKMENKTLEIKVNSLLTEKYDLENKSQQLCTKISELNNFCQVEHVDKHLLQCENEQSERFKRQLADMEGILGALTNELNEKVNTIENLRQLVAQGDEDILAQRNRYEIDELLMQKHKTKSTIDVDINKDLLLQTNSEISFLKSKVQSELEPLKSSGVSKSASERRSLQHSDNIAISTRQEIDNLQQTIVGLESLLNELNEKLAERNENISHLQNVIIEKDKMIEKAYEMIKMKNESIDERERKLSSVSKQNTYVKNELMEKSHDDENQLKLLLLSIKNKDEEILRLQSENDRCRLEIHKLKSEKSDLKKDSMHDVPSLGISTTTPSSMQHINKEIKKLYVDFEEKSKEIKEYSLKEIKNRDRKIDELSFELKLKADQFQSILLENKRLHDTTEDLLKKSEVIEQDLLMKEELLNTLSKEKDKIRSTFITEFDNKNEELDTSTKTVYFLNAEIHRLASELELVHSELNVVKLNESHRAESRNTLEISQANIDNLKTENNSLKLQISAQADQLETMKQEMTVKQVQNEKLIQQVQSVMSKADEVKRNSSQIEVDLQKSVDDLTKQLTEIEKDYRNLLRVKTDMEAGLVDVQNDNLTLKQVVEKLQTEKNDYKMEIIDLQSKIDLLNNNLMDHKNQLSRQSVKFDSDQHELKRMSTIIENNRKSISIQDKTLTEKIMQVDELTKENNRYKIELGAVTDQFNRLEMQYRQLSENFEKCNDKMMDKDKGLKEHQEMESQLVDELRRKSINCDQLKTEYEAMKKILEELQKKCLYLETKDDDTLKLLEQKNSQFSHVEISLEQVKKQLHEADEKWILCNNQWSEKYGLLKNRFDLMEIECSQLQNKLAKTLKDRDVYETNLNSQQKKVNTISENYMKLSEDNSRLMRDNCIKTTDLDRLCCEKIAVEKCNFELTSQLESMNCELEAAHQKICELTLKLQDSQLKINEISLKLKENFSSPPACRHYGSQPMLLHRADLCGGTLVDNVSFQQKDYYDLKTRYNALCGQIDNLCCQLKKKERRLVDKQKECDQLIDKLANYNQIQCDLKDLECEYHKVKEDCENLSHYCRNMNYSHNQDSVEDNDHNEDENENENDNNDMNHNLHETIDCQHEEIENLKSFIQDLLNDYRSCCHRIKELEDGHTQSPYQFEVDNWNPCMPSDSNYRTSQRQIVKTDFRDETDKCTLDRINTLKQEVMEKTNQILELKLINEDLDQQQMKYRQQINCQNQLMDELKEKIDNLEQKLDQNRYNATMVQEMQELVDCLTDKNRQLQCTVDELQTKFHSQCLKYNQLKQQYDCDGSKFEEMQQSYEKQCCNVNKLSFQLLEKDQLIDRLTEENNVLSCDTEVNQQKISQLIKQISSLNECLTEKDNVLMMTQSNLEATKGNLIVKGQESMTLSNDIEYLTEKVNEGSEAIEELKKELSLNYEIINRLKLEKAQIYDELNRLDRLNMEKDQCIYEKNELLSQYCKELEKKFDNIQKMQKLDRNSAPVVSAQEYFDLKRINEKLTEQVYFLQAQLDNNYRSMMDAQSAKGSSTFAGNHYLSNSIQSPMSEYRFVGDEDVAYNVGGLESSERNKSDLRRDSDVSYSSTKSVTWKSTHTNKQPTEKKSSVRMMELQKAIDNYNTLVTNIDMSDGPSVNPRRESRKSITAPAHDRGSGRSNNRLSENKNLKKYQDDDYIVVDVDSAIGQTKSVDSKGLENVRGSKSRSTSGERRWEQHGSIIGETKSIDSKGFEKVPRSKSRTKSGERHQEQVGSLIGKTNSVNSRGIEKVPRSKSRTKSGERHQEQVGSVIGKTNSVDSRGIGKVSRSKSRTKSGERHQEQVGSVIDKTNSVNSRGIEKVPRSKSRTKSGERHQEQVGSVIGKTKSVDSKVSRSKSLTKSVEIQQTQEQHQMRETNEIIDFLKYHNVPIDFDESKESFKSYLYRLVQKYNELEQFYFASLKINTGIFQDDDDLLRTLTGGVKMEQLFENSKQDLIHNCQLIHSSIAYQTVEIDKNTQVVNDQRLSTGDLLKMIDVIRTQQLQLSAVQLAHRNLERIDPIADIEKVSHVPVFNHLNEQYQQILISEDICNSDIREEYLKMHQMSLNEKQHQEQQQKKSVRSSKSEKTFPTVTRSMRTSMESLKFQNRHKQQPEQKILSREISSLDNSKKYKTRPLSTSLQNITRPIETVKSRPSSGFKSDSAIQKVEPSMLLTRASRADSPLIAKSDPKSFGVVSKSPLTVKPHESIQQSHQYELIQPLDSETVSIDRTIVKIREYGAGFGNVFQQNIVKGISVTESEATAIKGVQDIIGHASIEDFEKEMHKLSNDNIDFDNLDESVLTKDNMRICLAEISYLNEKNLFHTFVMHVLSNPNQYSQNTDFIHQINVSLIDKAKVIAQLQKELQFDSHISKMEKDLIAKVLDPTNEFTYENLFENWFKENERATSTNLISKINELNMELELCKSQIDLRGDKSKKFDPSVKIIENLVKDKQQLTDQINENVKVIAKISTENSVLRSKLSSENTFNKHIDEIAKFNVSKPGSSDNLIKANSQEFSADRKRLSKIPMLKGSTIESQSSIQLDQKSLKWDDVNKRIFADLSNVTKTVNDATGVLEQFRSTNHNVMDLANAANCLSNLTGKLVKAIEDIKLPGQDKSSKDFIGVGGTKEHSTLESSVKHVSPKDVQLTIANETSLDSLKHFATLLAEDNFDLAAEIEKLLGVVGDLRNQLKENCDILAETVAMLQNSEDFVNQMEQKLGVETKKTQVITNRIDKLNELNGKVIVELERILKQPLHQQSPSTNGSIEERYDYLFGCLKQIEEEKLNLQ